MATATKPRTAPAKPSKKSPVDTSDSERTIVYLDPALLVRDECNARETDTGPDADLLASVKEIGVEEPVSVRPRPDGTYGVFKGWRRTQAQQQANATAEADGRPQRKIPAIVREDLVGRDGWTRMLSLTENARREQMTERDTLKAIELTLVDMSEVEQRRATKALNLPPGAAKAARKAAKLSDAELRSATAEGMDLEQMADLAEVGDLPNARWVLEQAKAADEEEGKGGRGHWDHAMARLRQQLADREARAAAEKALAEAGIPLLRKYHDWEKDPSRPLSQLTTPLGAPLDETRHKTCPGHSARLDEEHRPVWHCADPAQYGHKLRPEAKKPKKPLSPEEAAERRRVIACNKAWRAAREVRKNFVATLCQGKTLPEEARKPTLSSVLRIPYAYRDFVNKGGTGDVARFLGIKVPDDATVYAVDLAGQVSRAKEWHALFAHVAAAYEHDLRENKAWARLRGDQARWLLLLESLGYTLSEVEEMAVARHRKNDRKTT